jgi:hypothetical protein
MSVSQVPYVISKDHSWSITVCPFPFRGLPSPSLRELIPARSDFRVLVSYRTYRLGNFDQSYDHEVARGFNGTVKALCHAMVEGKFSGEYPIEVLTFLRAFKESSDHLNFS